MSDIILYNTDKNQIQIQVKFDNRTVWLNQSQLATLFDTDRTSILKHIKNIYATKELDEDATCENLHKLE